MPPLTFALGAGGIISISAPSRSSSSCWNHSLASAATLTEQLPNIYRLSFSGARGDRLHLTLAYVSPMQFEENWLANEPRQARS